MRVHRPIMARPADRGMNNVVRRRSRAERRFSRTLSAAWDFCVFVVVVVRLACFLSLPWRNERIQKCPLDGWFQGLDHQINENK